jgi:3-isopropylmalate/(R)-2-methylmalate dehydratase small subunit
MEKFTTLSGVAAPLPMVNVDTDMIIPKQFLKTIKRTGLKEGLFYEMRWTGDGQKKDFVLDRPQYQKAQIIVSGPNFGCGSSREHAPWALLDFGIRCVISESFADIFHNNCFKNGILPIKLPKDQVAKLMEVAQRGSNAVISVDLEAQTVTDPDGNVYPFDVDPHGKECLIHGLDDIGQTLKKASSIDTYEQRQKMAEPWLA